MVKYLPVYPSHQTYFPKKALHSLHSNQIPPGSPTLPMLTLKNTPMLIIRRTLEKKYLYCHTLKLTSPYASKLLATRRKIIAYIWSEKMINLGQFKWQSSSPAKTIKRTDLNQMSHWSGWGRNSSTKSPLTGLWFAFWVHSSGQIPNQH